VISSAARCDTRTVFGTWSGAIAFEPAMARSESGMPRSTEARLARLFRVSRGREFGVLSEQDEQHRTAENAGPAEPLRMVRQEFLVVGFRRSGAVPAIRIRGFPEPAASRSGRDHAEFTMDGQSRCCGGSATLLPSITTTH
jgi:hypothetical protein